MLFEGLKPKGANKKVEHTLSGARELGHQRVSPEKK